MVTGVIGSKAQESRLEAGTRQFNFSLKDLPDGIYLFNVRNAEGINTTKKLAIIR